MNNVTIPDQLHATYRMPPVKQNSYVIFKRGESFFALNSGQLIRVVQFSQIPCAQVVLTNKVAYGTLHDFLL